MWYKGLMIGLPTNLSVKAIYRRIRWQAVYKMSFKWEGEILERAYEIVVFSRNMQKQYEDLYQNRRVPKVLYPGIAQERFRRISYDDAKTWISNVWDIPRHHRIILYVGRLEPDKQVHLLIDAFTRLKNVEREIYENTTMLIVGDGSSRKYLASHAFASKISSNVRFCGFQSEDLDYYYSGAWISVLPTLIESFGHVLLEAAVCRTPTIAFRPDGREVLTAADEIIIDNVTGILASNPNVESLFQSILRALQWNLEKRAEVGNAACQYVINKYKWSEFVDALVSLSSKSVAK